MRRSIDFGTLTGSLSTLKSNSRSNGNSNPDSSPSGSSRFGIIAGIPSSSNGDNGNNGNNDTFARPRSALSNGNGGRRGNRGHFGLAGLFNVGQQSGNSNSKNKDEYTQVQDSNNVSIQHSQSATNVNESTSSPSARDVDGDGSEAQATPSTPDTPAEREQALMQAVKAAKIKDKEWEIIVQLAPQSDSLFLGFHGNSSSNGVERVNRAATVMSPSSKLKKTPSSNGTGGGNGNMMFGALSGRARRFLGRNGDKNTVVSPLSSTTEEGQGEAEASPSTHTGHTSMHTATPPVTPGTARTTEKDLSQNEGVSSPSNTTLLTPTSPAKRRFESNEDDESVKVGLGKGSASPGPVMSTPALNAATNNVDADQLLVLYVTTGSSSLTLYRKLGQLIKLDDELRKHYNAHMPTTSRPSLLALPLLHRPTSPTGLGYGHARRKSVLASLTRTFTSPTISRKPTTPTSSSMLSSVSQTSIQEDTPAASTGMVSNGEGEGQQASSSNSLVSSQLSDSADYLTSLSCVAVVRASKQWNSFFKPTREDHESSRLEPVAASHGTTSKGRRLKRMKSDTGLQTRSSPVSGPPETPDRKGVRIDDSGIGIGSMGRGGHSTRDGSAGSTPGGTMMGMGIGHGHPTESSMDSFATSASASMMKREVSTGTNTSVSAMSIFIEHTEEDDQEVVGDPEVLEYMERLRQDSEARNAAKDAFRAGEKAKKASKATILDDVPPTPTSPTAPPEAQERELEPTPTALLPVELASPGLENTIPPVNSPSDEPVLAALEESLDAELDEAEEESPLPPLSGVTAVASEEPHSEAEAATPALTYDASPQQHNDGLLSPVSAANGSEFSPPGSLNGKKKKSASSLRRQRKSSVANTSLMSRGTRTRHTSIRIEDFEILRVLGKGCAGKVLLARLKDVTSMSTTRGEGNALYAIKAIHKHHVLAHRELAHTLTEQSILRKMVMETRNPFVVVMRSSFQDQDNLFLVLDFHPGGDLATQLSRWGRLGKDRTRFYAAEIIEGLESLHSAGVIYRDLKPENILLAADGHIVLTDFGLSKQFDRPPLATSDSGTAPSVPSWMNTGNAQSISQSKIPWVGKNETTTTFCGTAEYLAPEVLLGHAYSYPVDMWSLGTMIYEMLLGVTPFYNEDHGVMYRRVLHEQLDFGPSDFIDADTRALLRGLLQKEPEFRMTTSRVKRAKYFEAIDWQFINTKRYIPPFIPHLSPDDPADTQNFEDCFLTMDLGFVDPKDTEEIEAKAKTSGKEPDQAFDEDGRDVFADYSFDGAWADPDSEDDIEEGADEEQDGASDDGGFEGHEAQDVPAQILEEGDSSAVSHATADTPIAVETAVDTDAVPLSGDHKAEPSADKRTHEAASSSMDRNGSTEEQDDATGMTPPVSSTHEAREENKEEEHVKVTKGHTVSSSDTLGQSHFRNSVEMPRLASPEAAMSSEGVPRISADHEEWDLVEAMGSDEVADNGRKPPRRRLMAGTNLFAKGVVDKYRMQLKPLSRVPTPTRSYTSRSPITRLASGSMQPSRSAKTSNQLSPTPSIGGMSETPSSAESSEQTSRAEKKSSKGIGRRMVTPRLLRASSDWISSSLPTSPTPRFRMKRSKKGTAPEAMTPPIEEHPTHTNLEPSFVRPTPKSVDSFATVPVENAGQFGLQPLTRQLSRNRGSPESYNSKRSTSSLRNGGESASPSMNGDRQGPKLQKFLYPIDTHDRNDESSK